MRLLRRKDQRQAKQLARLLVALDAAARDRRAVPVPARRTVRASVGAR